MRLTDLSLGHRATVFFVLVGMVIAGLLAYGKLPREANPDIDLPIIVVYTLYPGASPADVESQVTRPLEREIKGVDGLKELTSISQESASVVTAEFASGINIDEALAKVRDRVDRAEADFPDEAEDSLVEEVSFSDIPVIQVHLSGEVGPAVLKRLAEELQDRLESLSGVLRVGLVGGLEREVQVDVDPEKLEHYGLALGDVIDAVRDENVSIPGGDLDVGGQTYAVRVPGEVEDPKQIADFVIEARDGSPVYIRDVAEVRFGFEDRNSFARIDGAESVALSVQKRQGANIVDLADRVRAEVADESRRWPSSVKATLLADESEEIRRMVADLENNILSGLVLVIVVLMFALGFRTALFVGLSIPFSMLATFVVLDLAGVSLNIVVLFSLVLAVGMLVDNAVVVIENIYRHMQQGAAPLDAAAMGTRQVGAAILVSTLTTVGAFSPLLVWPGVVGEFMSFLPLTLSIALLASLLVAFTVNPVICATFLRVRPSDRKPVGAEPEDEEDTEDELFDGPKKRGPGELLMANYRRLLGWALDHRAVVILLAAVTFVSVVLLYSAFNRGVEFFPETDPPQIVVDVELAPGTRLERTDAVLRRIEQGLTEMPDLEVMAAGSGAGSQAEFLGEGGGGDAMLGRITLDLVDRDLREKSSFVTMEEVRAQLTDLPGVTSDVKRPPEGPPVGDPIEIQVSGDDFEALGAIAARIRDLIADIPGLVSLKDDFDLARPELTVRIDRTEAARLGLTTSMIASTVRTAINGTDASVHRYGEDEADVVVRLAERFRNSPAALESLVVVPENGAQVPLSAVAEVTRTSSLTSIRHSDQKRMVTISGKVTAAELAEPVRSEAQRRIESMPDLVPAGYAVSFGGQSEEEEEAKAFLGSAFLYALIIILALMVGKFNSIVVPMIILTSVGMSMVGVLTGLLVGDLPFGIIMTGLGVISLAGIVVNNAIVLLDYGEQLVARGGLSRRRIVMETGQRRLRPVLLTAVTTVLGLVPLATGVEFDFRALVFSTGGESSQWWRSMAVAVIFGLALATVLTLVLVPVLYDLLLEMRERRAARRRDGSPDRDPSEDDPDSGSEELEPENATPVPDETVAVALTGDPA